MKPRPTNSFVAPRSVPCSGLERSCDTGSAGSFVMARPSEKRSFRGWDRGNAQENILSDFATVVRCGGPALRDRAAVGLSESGPNRGRTCQVGWASPLYMRKSWRTRRGSRGVCVPRARMVSSGPNCHRNQYEPPHRIRRLAKEQLDRFGASIEAITTNRRRRRHAPRIAVSKPRA